MMKFFRIYESKEQKDAGFCLSHVRAETAAVALDSYTYGVCGEINYAAFSARHGDTLIAEQIQEDNGWINHGYQLEPVYCDGTTIHRGAYGSGKIKPSLLLADVEFIEK